MNITIHRGLEQIGGCITEISTATTRIFIDFGKNLPGYGERTSPEQDKAMVLEIFANNKKQHEAVFYTHAHEDHIGLFRYIPESVSQFIGEGALQMLQTKYSVMKEGDDLGHNNPAQTLEALDKLSKFNTWKRIAQHDKPKTIEFGDIRVTPFFCSHSIYDSYMFLIEADGKRIWHTGDYRAHGYLGKGLIPTLKKYAKKIDTLITEGTMLSRDAEECIHESKVASLMTDQMRKYDYVFVLLSATDIDRIATIRNAAANANKKLLINGKFQYETMKLFSKREGHSFNGLYRFNPQYFNSKGLEYCRENGFVLMVGATHIKRTREIYEKLDPEQCLLIYSTWEGYYKIPEQVAINSAYKEFREMFIHCIDIHTSGHADRNTIEEVVRTVNAKEVIVIHKDAGVTL